MIFPGRRAVATKVLRAVRSPCCYSTLRQLAEMGQFWYIFPPILYHVHSSFKLVLKKKIPWNPQARILVLPIKQNSETLPFCENLSIRRGEFNKSSLPAILHLSHLFQVPRRGFPL